MAELAIVIPVFNAYHHTRPCLNDMARLPKSHTVIIVDNGSTDATKDLKSVDNILVYHLEKNWGFASACNYGYEVARNLSDNVMFLNNDIKVMNNHSLWTYPIINKCKDGLIGPTICVLDDFFDYLCSGSKLPSNRKNVYMSGWCISSSVENWEKLKTKKIRFSDGPFSEEFFVFFEDADLGFRAKQLGIPFIIEEIPVRHFGHATAKNMNISKLYQNSKKIFTEKWAKKDSL
jgi:GT2 family glycosyltransferase